MRDEGAANPGGDDTVIDHPIDPGSLFTRPTVDENGIARAGDQITPRPCPNCGQGAFGQGAFGRGAAGRPVPGDIPPADIAPGRTPAAYVEDPPAGLHSLNGLNLTRPDDTPR